MTDLAAAHEPAPRPPLPTLVAEWRAILTLSGGVIVTVSYDSCADAEAAARRVSGRSSGATFRIERRLVSDWTPWSTPPTRTRGPRARQRG